jgi:hypothetical protein
VVTFTLCLSLLFSAKAGGLGFGEGTTLYYAAARIGTSGQGGYNTWNNSITILDINQTSLVFFSNSTAADSSMNSTITINYKDGIPTYADYLTALIYLPPECLAKTRSGDVNWTTSVGTTMSTIVGNGTSQTSNFTVPAGNFQCLNLTLTLTGMDFGTLTFIYDIASGILIYEQWVPNYGDIITLSLISENATAATGSILLDLIMPIAVLAIPFVMGIDQAIKRVHSRGRKLDVERDGGEPQNRRGALHITLAAAVLGVAAVLMPWGQLLGIPMYLPLSLQLVLINSVALSTPTMLAISFFAHAAAFLAWTSVAVQVYLKPKLTSRLLALASGVLAFVATTVFIIMGWALSWGSVVIVVAGIFAVAGALAAKENSRSSPVV